MKIIDPTPIPWHQRRVGIALRRILWLISMAPVGVLCVIIGILGFMLATIWIAILWLTGSTKINRYPIWWIFDIPDWIYESWDLLNK